MNTNRHVKNACRALGAAFALAAAIAFAGAPETPQSVHSGPLVLADASTPSATARAAASDRHYPPGEAGVRRAAAQGPEALRRYIWRTRMIYNYYYWDFATR
jgi:hypothetical protein